MVEGSGAYTLAAAGETGAMAAVAVWAVALVGGCMGVQSPAGCTLPAW